MALMDALAQIRTDSHTSELRVRYSVAPNLAWIYQLDPQKLNLPEQPEVCIGKPGNIFKLCFYLNRKKLQEKKTNAENV